MCIGFGLLGYPLLNVHAASSDEFNDYEECRAWFDMSIDAE